MSSLLTTLLAFLCIGAPATFANLNVDEFAELIAKRSVVVLDVRTPEEFAEGHIEGAVNVDVKAADFVEQFKALKLRKGQRIAVYCRSGRRSANACDILLGEGYRRVSNLSTGILGWTEAGKPAVK